MPLGLGDGGRCGFGADVRQEHHELVAGPAGDEVGLAAALTVLATYFGFGAPDGALSRSDSAAPP